MKNVLTKFYFLIIKTSKGKRLRLGVCRVESSAYYELGFNKYHYIEKDINKSSLSLLFSDKKGNPLAFVALLNQPFRDCPNAYAVSRFVILPKYQSKGLSVAIISAVGGMLKAKGKRLYITTHHERFGNALSKSKNFVGSANDGKNVKSSNGDPRYKSKMSGVAYRKRYIGKELKGYKVLFATIKFLRDRTIKMIDRKKNITQPLIVIIKDVIYKEICFIRIDIDRGIVGFMQINGEYSECDI